MLTLYFFGTYLSRLVGESKLLIAYFCGGIVGNVWFILLAPSYSIAIGASGAVFALGGALAVIRTRLMVFVFPIPVPIPPWSAVIGGLVFGLIAGYFFRKREPLFF